MIRLLLILLLIIPVKSWSFSFNEGYYTTQVGSAIFHQDLQILSERTEIFLYNQFETANCQTTYHLRVKENSVMIPFMFLLDFSEESISISIDGVAISDSLIRDFQIREDSFKDEFKSFYYAFERDSSNELFLKEELTFLGYGVNLHNMMYLRDSLAPGEHTIIINYRFYPERGHEEWIKNYKIEYALLSPALGPKFEERLFVINSENFDHTYFTNIGQPEFTNDSLQLWDINEDQTYMIRIYFEPEINGTAAFFIKISPFGLACIVGIILFFLHLWVDIKFRKKYPDSKHAVVAIVGSLTVPFFFLLMWIMSFYMIEDLVGLYANENSDFQVLRLVLYPIILPFYWTIFAFIDRKLKQKYIIPKGENAD